MIERSSLGSEFHNDGAATANARSPSVALDFTDGIARSRVLEPHGHQHGVSILISINLCGTLCQITRVRNAAQA